MCVRMKEWPRRCWSTPEPGPQGGAPMDATSVAYVLCRIEADSSLTPVSEHEDICAAVAAGRHRVEVEDFDFGHGLFVDGVRVASFAEERSLNLLGGMFVGLAMVTSAFLFWQELRANRQESRVVRRESSNISMDEGEEWTPKA